MQQPLFLRPWVRLASYALAVAVAFLSGAAAATAYDNRQRIIERLELETEKPFAETVTADWTKIETSLITLARADLPLGRTAWTASGGAIDAYGNTLLYASPSGHIATLDFDQGKIEYSPHRVPMNFDHLEKNVFPLHAAFRSDWFRVQDILIAPGPTPETATLYVSHHVFDEATNVLCGVVSQTSLELGKQTIELKDGNWTELYRMPECLDMLEFNWVYLGLEGGGKMLQLDAGHILLAVGDYGLSWEIATTARVGLQYANDFSKMIRINVVTGESNVFANGFRNPQGLAIDSDGQIWEAEHGPQGGDEINLITEGGDYGWPTVSLGTHYGVPRAPLPTNPVQGRHDGFIQPVMAFMPSVGLSAVTAMPDDPKAFGLWSGDLLATSLVGNTLFRIRREGDRLIYSEPISLGERMRDITLLENGWIAILGKQDENLILLRDATGQGKDTAGPLSIKGYAAVEVREDSVPAVLGEPMMGRAIFRDYCAVCHSVNGRTKAGPPLNGVVGRKIGGIKDYPYSDDLATADGRWTQSRLRAFMDDPKRMYPGTTMPGDFNMERWQRRKVAEYLATLE